MNDIVSWLRQRAGAAAARGFVVPLSGNIDSAVVARLCQLATPGQVVGAVTSSRSDPREEANAIAIAEAFALPVIRLDLDAASDALLAAVRSAADVLPADMRRTDGDGQAEHVAALQLRPRVRLAALYLVAESLQYLVAGTANRIELTVGAFAKYGDAADVLPVGHLLRSQVKTLARELGVPSSASDTVPDAERLEDTQRRFSYADVERYLTNGPEGVSPALALRLERAMRLNSRQSSVFSRQSIESDD